MASLTMQIGSLGQSTSQTEDSTNSGVRGPANCQWDLRPKPYRYSPLNEKAGEIRLFTLLPGSFTAKIKCRLEVVQLTRQEIPCFEALSYAWGDPTVRVPINVGDATRDTVAVTENLANALPYLRYPDKPRVLWIDAICVNQQDVDERSRQIQRMGSIFSSASQVIVWLGPEGDDSVYALQAMGRWGNMVKVHWSLDNMEPAVAREDAAILANRDLPLALDDRHARAIGCLLARSWFNRLWVRQEVYLAGDRAMIFVGGDAIEWRVFRTAVFCLMLKPVEINSSDTRQYDLHRRIDMVFSMCRDCSRESLDCIIHYHQHAKCFDPRDRVFAILPMCKSVSHGSAIMPDYSKPVGHVYRDVVLAEIGRTERLDIIRSCERQGSTWLNIPTWVPDWSRRRLSHPIALTAANARTLAPRRRVSRKLTAEGVHCGRIQRVQDFEVGEDSKVLDCINALRRLAPVDLGMEAYVDGGTLLEAFCRTTCGNLFAERCLTPSYSFPRWYPATQTLRRVLSSYPDVAELEINGDDTRYLMAAGHFLQGRCLYTTNDGRIGLAPKAAQPGDHIWVLLGCRAPIVLRPTGQRQYEVVGECYADGLMDGQAVLGPIPEHHRAVWVWNREIEGYRPGVLHELTGEILMYWDDPRLERLTDRSNMPASLRDARGIYRDPRLTPAALRRRGVALDTIELI